MDMDPQIFRWVHDIKGVTMYWIWMTFLLFVIFRTWHFLGWNSMSQSASHFCKLFKSSWSCMASAALLMSLYRAQSSAKSRTAEPQGTDVRLESPDPTPFIYQAKWKTWPIHILFESKRYPIHILFFRFYLFIYFLSEKDTPLIYFWGENDTHSYTWRPEKYTPFQPHICIYLSNQLCVKFEQRAKRDITWTQLAIPNAFFSLS